jgi:pimeloyl-ACP methyl ester carboxylesterase
MRWTARNLRAPCAVFHRFFYRREVVPVAGHFIPREAPQNVVDAMLELANKAK